MARADLDMGEGLLWREPSIHCLLQKSLVNTQTLIGESSPQPAVQSPVYFREAYEWALDILDINDDGLTGRCTSAQAPFVLHESVRKLPAGPGSGGLFISAVLTLGAWQVVRTARYGHLSHLPEWYHSDTPDQIGHTLVFDLQYVPIAACPLEQLKGKPDDIVGRWHDMPAYGLSQFFQIIESPRGPPIFSL